jgi:allantoin racemase
MARVILINPNTSELTTAMMVDTARAAAPSGLTIGGLTARHGASLIVNPEALAVAAAAVRDLAPEVSADGVIVAAFGDPGLDHLQHTLRVPVIGIGEAAIRAAHRGGRRFSIVTTTPGLEAPIRSRVAILGCGAGLASIRHTTEDPVQLTEDAARLEAALQILVAQCVSDDGAEAIIIGGGPLARAAGAIAGRTHVAIVEPVPAAVAWMAERLGLHAAR